MDETVCTCFGAGETPDEKLVMVWIHGGALITGEGAAYPGVVDQKRRSPCHHQLSAGIIWLSGA